MEEDIYIYLLQQGDELAFRKLVSLYSARVYNTTLSIVQQQQDAEDVTQEVFTEIFQSISQFKGEAKLSTWIYRITLSKSLEFLRKKNRKKRFGFMHGLFGDDGVSPIKIVTDFYHPGVQLENKEQAKILFAAIDKLPENQKTAFVLSKMENLSYTEIADIMKTSLSSVESLMFRAKQNLQKLLGDYYRENKL